MQNIIKLRKWYKAKPLLNKTEKKEKRAEPSVKRRNLQSRGKMGI